MPPPELHYPEVAADPERLPALRRAIGAWAAEAGLTSVRRKDLELVVYEAMANVARHAYRGVAGPMDVRARCHGGRIDVSITDHGRWLRPGVRDGDGGRGLPLIRGLADDATITGTEHGTTVSIVFSVARSATESNGSRGSGS